MNKKDVDLEAEFTKGVNDYWTAKCPDGWDGPNARLDPYLAGWNMAADQENGQGWFAEDDEVHEADLVSGVVTCSCGFKTQHYPLASDATAEFEKHLDEVEGEGNG